VLDQSVLLVPLRSNASALPSGALIAAITLRLKLASLLHDQRLVMLRDMAAYRASVGHG